MALYQAKRQRILIQHWQEQELGFCTICQQPKKPANDIQLLYIEGVYSVMGHDYSGDSQERFQILHRADPSCLEDTRSKDYRRDNDECYQLSYLGKQNEENILILRQGEWIALPPKTSIRNRWPTEIKEEWEKQYQIPPEIQFHKESFELFIGGEKVSLDP